MADQQKERGDDAGTITVSVVIAVSFALLLFIQLANISVHYYAKSVVQSALDEGARAGAIGGPAACQTRVDEVLDDLIPGMRDGVTVTCADAGTSIIVTADVSFNGWLSSLANYDGSFSASAAKEDQ